MKNSQYFIFFFIIPLFFSCGSSNSSSTRSTVNPHAQKHQQAHQEFALQEAQKKLTDDFIANIEGNYIGFIPCANCEGIEYQLKLNKNLSYTLQLLYKGRSEEIIKIEGFYSLSDTFMIVLDEKAGTMNYLKKLDKGLLLLDKNGGEIHGELAEAYVLDRVY
jgi:uncharacterized lipoprotein NlpE involved in copper resistance